MARSIRAAFREVFAAGPRTRTGFPTVSIRLEALEDRTTPATFSVTSFEDTDDIAPGDGKALDAFGEVTLRSAIQEANTLTGDHKILIPAPIGGATIALLTTLDKITADIEIGGPGETHLTVTRGNASVVGIFSVAADSHSAIAGLTIAGGVNTAGDGGGIENQGILTVTACKIQGCSAPNGGAIRNTGEIVIQGCTIANNIATSGHGGGMLNTGKATIDQSSFNVNQAPAGRGGGIASFPAGSICIITNSYFDGNFAGWGGAIYLSGGTLSVSGGAVANNTATAGDGGGIYGQGTITVTGVNIHGNKAYGSGGAIRVNLPGTSSCILQDCEFADNECNTGGKGGVGPNVAYSIKAPTIINCTGLELNEPVRV